MNFEKIVKVRRGGWRQLDWQVYNNVLASVSFKYET